MTNYSQLTRIVLPTTRISRPRGSQVYLSTGKTDVDTLHFDESGELPSSFDAPSDFGLSETRSYRWITLRWCSCQFSVAFGGLP